MQSHAVVKKIGLSVMGTAAMVKLLGYGLCVTSFLGYKFKNNSIQKYLA
jgi:hypothetical protein